MKVITFPICKWELLPLSIYFYNIFLDYDVSLHILVVLVMTIPTSPRLSKTEFVCESSCVFGSIVFFRQNIRKRKKKVRSRPGRAQAGARPVSSATRPAHPALAWPAQAGGRPAGSGYHPAQLPRQAGPRPGPGRATCCRAAFFISFDRCPLCFAVFPGRPGRLPAGPRPGTLLPLLSHFFSSNGSFLEPPIKGVSSPFFVQISSLALSPPLPTF